MTTESPKAALVTGGARRIGRTIALALANRGWDVVVHYGQSGAEARALAQEICATGRRAACVQSDLADENSVKSLLARANAALSAADSACPPISCIVNNASKFEQDSAADFSMVALDAHMHPNLVAPILLAQALHAATPDGAQAAVINLLDQKLFNPNPDFFSYTLSKAALHSATILLAQALAPKLRVVGVAPGISLISGDQSPEGFAKAHAQTPLGRSSTPEDIAAAVCFAAESPAITGTTLLVDGGQHLSPSPRDVMFLAK
jgi:NAD(P)-dependent dehydrogenase (short-subunit alcohol dehydrogenase family)